MSSVPMVMITPSANVKRKPIPHRMHSIIAEKENLKLSDKFRDDYNNTTVTATLERLIQHTQYSHTCVHVGSILAMPLNSL